MITRNPDKLREKAQRLIDDADRLDHQRIVAERAPELRKIRDDQVRRLRAQAQHIIETDGLRADLQNAIDHLNAAITDATDAHANASSALQEAITTGTDIVQRQQDVTAALLVVRALDTERCDYVQRLKDLPVSEESVDEIEQTISTLTSYTDDELVEVVEREEERIKSEQDAAFRRGVASGSIRIPDPFAEQQMQREHQAKLDAAIQSQSRWIAPPY